jgi:hypothetical protein
MSNEIFVIVENVQITEWGETKTEEVICQREGYFIDDNSAERRDEAMNEADVKTMRQENDPDEDALEEWETHYGYIPLEMNRMNRG